MSAHQDDKISHKIFSLLPLTRHATFRVTLSIHDVTNIPFQNGSFSLQWKFKNVRSNSGGHRLATSRPSTPGIENGKRRRPLAMMDSETEAGGRTSIDEPTARLKITAIDKKGKGRVDDLQPSVTVEPPTPLVNTPPDGSASNVKYGQFLSPAGPEPIPAPNPSTSSVPLSSSSSSTPIPTPSIRADDTQKGHTDFVPLKDHTVRWDHTVEVVVPFKIKRDTSELLPCDLKLVLQEHIPNASLETLPPAKFGVVVLNLAQYADRGPVTRRYLLDESKTNATLRLTIDAVRISGDKDYVVPDLRKGQAVANVAGVLSSEHFLPFVNVSPNSAASLSQVQLLQSISGPSTPGLAPHTPDRPPIKNSITNKSLHKFLVDQSQHSAESVVEMLFNPIPTTSTSSSPFTYYSPNAQKLQRADSSAGSSASVSVKRGPTNGRPSTGRTTSTLSSVEVDGSSIEESSLDHSLEMGVRAGDDSLAASTASMGSTNRHWWQRRSGKTTPAGGSGAVPRQSGESARPGMTMRESSWLDVSVPQTPLSYS